MKTNNQIFPMISLVILNFVFLMLSTGFNHIPAVYSQNQSSSFQAEARALDDMPTQKVKVGDITIARRRQRQTNPFNHRTWCYDGHMESTSFRATIIIKLFRYYFR